MKAKFFLYSFFSCVILAVLFTGCKKQIADLAEKESEADRNSIFAQLTFDQEEAFVDNALLTQSGAKSTNAGPSMSNECLVLTYDLVSTPMKLTLDFGTSNCLSNDGKNRRGKMFVTFNGAIKDSLTVVTLSFENYFVNDNQVIGSRSVTNKGRNAAGHLNNDIVTDGSIVMANNAGTITYQSNHNREWTAGESTLLPADDIYSFSGAASGTTIKGQDFTTTITSPIVWKMSCTNFVSGVFELKPAGDPKRTIDFGDGECDNSATIKVLLFTFQITLPG